MIKLSKKFVISNDLFSDENQKVWVLLDLLFLSYRNSIYLFLLFFFFCY